MQFFAKKKSLLHLTESCEIRAKEAQILTVPCFVIWCIGRWDSSVV
jgi:hypothetical protein